MTRTSALVVLRRARIHLCLLEEVHLTMTFSTSPRRMTTYPKVSEVLAVVACEARTTCAMTPTSESQLHSSSFACWLCGFQPQRCVDLGVILCTHIGILT